MSSKDPPVKQNCRKIPGFQWSGVFPEMAGYFEGIMIAKINRCLVSVEKNPPKIPMTAQLITGVFLKLAFACQILPNHGILSKKIQLTVPDKSGCQVYSAGVEGSTPTFC